MRYIVIILVCLFMVGCETTKCFLGISTKDIEEARYKAVSKVFNYDMNTSREKTEAALKTMKAYVYAKQSDMIACYNTYTDTTPVGVYFKAVDNANTQIEVASPSSPVRDGFAEKLFQALSEGETQKQ